MNEIHLTPGTTISEIINAIVTGDIIVASDGSVENQSGTYGWVIAVKSTGIKLVENSGWVHGGSPSSY